jgi:hypothetical protein
VVSQTHRKFREDPSNCTCVHSWKTICTLVYFYWDNDFTLYNNIHVHIYFFRLYIAIYLLLNEDVKVCTHIKTKCINTLKSNFLLCVGHNSQIVACFIQLHKYSLNPPWLWPLNPRVRHWGCLVSGCSLYLASVLSLQLHTCAGL